MHDVEITKPATLQDALASFQSSDEAMFLAGGMTFIPSMKAHLATPTMLIDLSGIPEMSGIVDTGSSLRIGAMTRLADIARSDVIQAAIPELARMARMIADRHGFAMIHKGERVMSGRGYIIKATFSYWLVAFWE